MIHPDAATANALGEAIAKLELIQAKIVSLSDRTDESWRRELIALRRDLQTQIRTIVELLRTIGPHNETAIKLGHALGALRSCVALHQANWPAVVIDRSDPLYHESVREIRAVSREFQALVDRQLPGMRRR